MKDTGITPESIHYDKGTKTLGLLPFRGTSKDFEEYMKRYSPYADIVNEEVIMGHEEVYNKYLHLFKKYKGLQRYNCAFV